MNKTVQVQVTRSLKTSSERAFDAWLDPKVAGRFLFATPTGTMVKVEIDARIGGRFNFTERRGDDDVEHVGEYLEIDRPTRLAFSFAVSGFLDQPSTVALAFRPLGDGCEVTLTHDGVLEGFAERTADGWGGILERLEQSIA